MGVRLRIAIVALVLGIIVIAIGMEDFLITSKKPVGYYELEISEIKEGLYVEDEIFLVMDNVGTEVTTTNNSERESAREYALPIILVDGEDLYISQIMGMKIFKSEDYRVVEKIIDDTVEWWNDETGTVDIGETGYPITGKIRKMKDDEKKLMVEYASEVFDISKAEAEEYVLPYVLEPIARERVLVFMAIGVMAFVAGVGLLVWEIASRRR